jgi:hypothetical protein
MLAIIEQICSQMTSTVSHTIANRLLVLERGFQAGFGNTIRVYQVFSAGCPRRHRRGVARGARGDGLGHGDDDDDRDGRSAARGREDRDRHRLYLVSDDNFSAGQVTRIYELSVRLRRGRSTH